MERMKNPSPFPHILQVYSEFYWQIRGVDHHMKEMIEQYISSKSLFMEAQSAGDVAGDSCTMNLNKFGFSFKT